MICEKCNQELNSGACVCHNCGNRASYNAQKQMVEETKNAVGGVLSKSFRTPLFMAIAICFSVVSVATLILVLTSDFDLISILALVLSIFSTVYAWLLYAGHSSNKNIKNLRLYLVYSRVINTILLVAVSIIAVALLIACISLSIMSDKIDNELVPVLENEIKPLLENIAENDGQPDGMEVDLEKIYNELPQDVKDSFGIRNVEDLESLIAENSQYAEGLLYGWDEIIYFLTSGWIIVAVIVFVVFAILITAFEFVVQAYKRAAKYLMALAEDQDADKKAPKVVLYIGGALVVLGGLSSLGTDTVNAIISLAAGVALILFAEFFKSLAEARINARVAVSDAEAELARILEQTETEQARMAAAIAEYAQSKTSQETDKTEE